MKKILFPLLTLLLVLFIAACSTNTPSNHPTLPKYKDPAFGVSTQQLITDLSNPENEILKFESHYVTETQLNYDSHSITKRQINENQKQDIIYLTVDASNEYFKASFDLELRYIFYEYGGWILEQKQVKLTSVAPLSAPSAKALEDKHNSMPIYVTDDPDCLDAYIKKDDVSLTYATTLHVLSSDYTDGHCTFTVEVSSKCLKIIGKIDLFFSEKYGWVVESWRDLIKRNNPLSETLMKNDKYFYLWQIFCLSNCNLSCRISHPLAGL